MHLVTQVIYPAPGACMEQKSVGDEENGHVSCN